MITIEDEYVGKIYGCYEIISRTNQRANDGHIIYNCRCIHCGIIKQMKLSSVKYKKSSKCTHFITIGNVTVSNDIENISIPNARLRSTFLSMLRRCYDANNKDYRFYGQKGISVCDEWIENPSNFINGLYQMDITIN